jgi:hypothetical protein
MVEKPSMLSLMSGAASPCNSQEVHGSFVAPQHQDLYRMPVGQRTIKSMDATTIWTLLSIFVIAPLGALAFDRPLFGNWIWHIHLGNARD